MKKRILAMLMSLVLMIGIMPMAALATEDADLEAAIFWYDYNDLFLSYVREALDADLEAAGVSYTNYDADGSQAIQNDQIDTAIAQGADVLIVNIVDTAAIDAAQAIVDKAKAADLPVIFVHRVVADSVINSYENACLVTTRAAEAGGMQGKMAADYILANYDAVDLNDDGQISYIMMKGELGNPEAEWRTRYAVEFCNNALTEAEKPELVYYDEANTDYFQPCNWSKTEAFNLMETALTTNPMNGEKPIELVFANNDDAALGCIDALNNVGWNTGEGKSIPVFGIDCVFDAMAAMEAGKMTGSVLQSAENMAETVAALVNNVADGNNVFDGADEMFNIDENTAKIRVPYAMILEGEAYETDFDYDYEFEDYDYIFVPSIDCDVAVFWYDFSDWYLNNVRNALEEELWSMGATVTNYDAASSQATQNDQIDVAVSQGADVLVVNIVDAFNVEAAQAIVDKAVYTDTPVIFFNREVADVVINSYENACYVGVRAEEAGEAQGIMVGQYLAENYDAVDLNGDGKIAYIMMKGQVENPEAEAKTRYAVELCNNILTAEGKSELKYFNPNNEDKFQATNWRKDLAFEQMTTALGEYPMDGENPIELVFANNDDAALGCVEALNNVDWNTGEGNSIPVFGIDFTMDAAYAIQDGRMTGTIYQSSGGMAATVAALVNNVGNGENVFANAEENFNVDDNSAKIRVPYDMITIDNLEYFMDIFGGGYDDFEGASGECGDNLTWVLDTDGVLTISGEGEMWDFEYYGAPWSGFNEIIYSVVIEEGVTRIGYNAFNPCYYLESVYIPNTVTRIDHGAFQECGILPEINIPASVTEIAHSAFNYCLEMTGIWVDEENPNYSSDENGILFNKDKTALIKVPCGYEGSYDVPTGVATIAESAFTGCEKIASIAIPKSVTSISEDAFNNCDILEEIVVDAGNQYYTSDEMGVLFNAEKAELICVPRIMTGNYVIPDGVVAIGIEAFRGCGEITSIYVPASLTNINSFNLKGSYNLTEVIVDDDNPNYCSENGLMYNKDKTELVFVPDGMEGTIVIPASVTSLDDDAFWYCERVEMVKFTGNAPSFKNYTPFFYPVEISYPADNPTWTEEVMASFGDYITWIPYSERVQGDVDGNGELSNTDLIMVARYIVELYDEDTVTDIEYYGDMNGDGVVTNTDLVIMARTVVGIEKLAM